jgi:hypothetical protein
MNPIASVLLILVLVCGGCAKQADIYTPSTLKAVLDTEVPRHATFGQVVAVLDRHHFKHADRIYRGSGFPKYNSTFTAWAPAGGDFIERSDLQILFKFSPSNVLLSYLISPVYTGL